VRTAITSLKAWSPSPISATRLLCGLKPVPPYIAGAFAAACGPAADNLILKAVATLGARVRNLKVGHFRLEKRIPVAGGLGGGSSDAAAAFRLLAGLNDLALDDPRVTAAALATGADVLVCLDPRPRVMRGIGEILSAPVVVPQLALVLVNPGVLLSTRDVFNAYTGTTIEKKNPGAVPREREAFIRFLEGYGNDLTQAAIACAPIVADVLETLRQLPGARLARMSGSGPTCFALFNSAAEATAAARQLRAAQIDWWVHDGSIARP